MRTLPALVVVSLLAGCVAAPRVGAPVPAVAPNPAPVGASGPVSTVSVLVTGGALGAASQGSASGGAGAPKSAGAPISTNSGALASNNAGGLVSNNAGGLVSNNASGLVSNNAGGLISNNASGLVSNNAGGLVSNNASGLVSNNAGGLVSNNAGGLVSDNTSALVSNNAGGLISNNAGGLVSNNASGLISNNAGGLVSNNAGGLVSNNAGGLLSNNAAGLTVSSSSGMVASSIGDAGAGFSAGPSAAMMTSADSGGGAVVVMSAAAPMMVAAGPAPDMPIAPVIEVVGLGGGSPVPVPSPSVLPTKTLLDVSVLAPAAVIGQMGAPLPVSGAQVGLYDMDDQLLTLSSPTVQGHAYFREAPTNKILRVKTSFKVGTRTFYLAGLVKLEAENVAISIDGLSSLVSAKFDAHCAGNRPSDWMLSEAYIKDLLARIAQVAYMYPVDWLADPATDADRAAGYDKLAGNWPALFSPGIDQLPVP